MNTENILMLGDSITDMYETDKYLPNLKIINKGVSGDSTEECLERITPEIFHPMPSKIFLCIGTNDFARDRSDNFVLENIIKIISKLRSYTNSSSIILTTIFPTRDNELRPNSRIVDFNKKLEELALKQNCNFFNLHKSFIDDAGKLKKEFTEDGLHLTDSAYKVWSNELMNYLESN